MLQSLKSTATDSVLGRDDCLCLLASATLGRIGFTPRVAEGVARQLPP
jgi:hypothetical protein